MKLSKSREESVISVTRRSCKHGKCSVIGIFMLKLSSGKVLIITHWRVYEDKCSKSVQDVAELVKNLTKDPYSEDEVNL